MLPDLSPAHILIVVVVALIVVGPKDLPMLLRKIGQFMGKMRGMANEFRASFDEMARQSELDDLRKEVEAMRAAANAATPDLGLDGDLGLNAALNSDAESAYVQDWQTSQYMPETSVERSILPPDAKPAKGGKAKAASTKTASTKGKSVKAASASRKTPATKVAVTKTKSPAAAKPSAKKTKPVGTAS